MLRIIELFRFPHTKEYEVKFHQELTKRMYKPLLIAVITVLMMVMGAVCFSIFHPEVLGPAEYASGLIAIHIVFIFFTLVILIIAVAFRRQLLQYPAWYIALCNTYAIGVCLWASAFSAYAHFSPPIYTAFITVTLGVAMICLYKPLLAVVAFGSNYVVYVMLLLYFRPEAPTENLTQIYNAGVVSIMGVIIATAFYRFRARTFCDRMTIADQLDEISKINLRLQQLVHVDSLTGLFNQRYYEEKLATKLQKLNSRDNVCCIMLDIDYFKKYNDHFGHPAGDECLRAVARVIEATIEPVAGTGVRYGGEEFFVFSQIDSRDMAVELAYSICRSVEELYIPHPSSPLGKVTVSCGVTYLPRSSGYSLHYVTQKADEALYVSKASGRNQVSFASLSAGSKKTS